MTTDVKEDRLLKADNLTLWLALKHHRTHKKESLDFSEHAYLKQLYASDPEFLVVIKSTQCGVTEWELVRTISHAMQGLNVFVAFPTDILVGRFVSGRFFKSLSYTPFYRYLQAKFRDAEDSRNDSMRMLDIGAGTVCWVGSNSEANFTEFPADEIIIEELDQCDPKNIKMANERLAHSQYRYQVWISNPTYEGFGIDDKFKDTNQQEWVLKADCGHWILLDWFKHIVKEIDKNRYIILDDDWSREGTRDIYPICHKCGKPINRRLPGLWLKKNDNHKDGMRITKLFSGSTSMVELLEKFNKGLSDPREMQRFHNADLGRAFTAEGAKISRKMILDAVEPYASGPEEGLCIAGIDVGTFYYYVIQKLMPDGRIKTLKTGQERDTKQLISILKEYNIKCGIIDGLPETREAKKISNNFPLLFLCYFGSSKSDVINFEQKSITVQRTPALDAVKEAIMLKTIMYPKETAYDETFLNQMTASTRIFNQDRKASGQIGLYEWVEGSREDHYFLASAYSLIARRLIQLINQ